jgi:uracil-DNA glycosylase
VSNIWFSVFFDLYPFVRSLIMVDTVDALVSDESAVILEIVQEPLAKKQRSTSEEADCPSIDIPLSRGMESPLFSYLTHPSWREILQPQFSEMYFHDLTRFLAKELKTGKVFPSLENIFASLNACSFADVKIVILGQDPYHDEDQAMGLSFSIPEGMKLPSSLLNIYKELESDLGIPRSKNGDLSKWSKQGVLLLNAVLSVRAHKANSHEGKGWERFTDHIIKQVSEKSDNVVFMLWGKFAEKKAGRVDGRKHLVLKSPHPSGLSASRGFFGSKHFSKANEYLKTKGRTEIDWVIE